MRRHGRDYAAGERLARMRVDQGWSYRELSVEMLRTHPANARMHVSERTLRRVEEEGVVPTPRVQFAIAAAFGLLPSQLWGSRDHEGDRA